MQEERRFVSPKSDDTEREGWTVHYWKVRQLSLPQSRVAWRLCFSLRRCDRG